MLRSRNEILMRVALLKQQERELRDRFSQASLGAQDTQQMEAMLVSIVAEIAVLESMISTQ